MRQDVCDLIARLKVAETLLEKNAGARTQAERIEIGLVLRDARAAARQAGVSDAALRRASEQIGRRAGLRPGEISL